MHYMPTDSEATCQAVSSAIYKLTRPLGSTDGTLYAFGWRQATDGTWWMEWPNDMELPIHAERGTETLDTLATFVTADLLTQASADAVVAIVQANVDGTVTLGQVTPPEWSALMLTEEQAASLWSEDGP